MAKSRYQQEQYPTRDFVESAGAILFDFRHTGLTNQQLLLSHEPVSTSDVELHSTIEPSIALFYSGSRNEMLLPKGRRNINEARDEAAIRETYEETGLKCQLLPVTLHSRATSVDPKQDKTNPEGYTLNEVRHFKSALDPFWMTVRHEKDRQGKGHVKLIWWYVAVVDDVQDPEPIELDPGCELRLVSLGKAEEACTYEGDREIVREAIRVVQETLGWT